MSPGSSMQLKDGTHECEIEHLKPGPGALAIIADLFNRVRQGEFNGRPQDNWLSDMNIPPPSPLMLDSAQAKVDASEVERLVDIVETLKVAAGALHSMCGCLRLRSETLAEHIGVLRMRRGLSSLPDEVLTDILKYAAFSSDIRHFHEARFATLATQAALKLSHVCQRFRSVIMRVSCLWSYVYNGMAPGLVSALCERLTGPIAEIVLNGPSYCSRIKASKFARIVVARPALWYRFDQGQEIDEYATSCWHHKVFRKELQDLTRITHQIHAPFLRELAVHFPATGPNDLRNSFHYYSTWSTPRLHSFTVSNSIPVHFSGSATLTYFKRALNCRSIDPNLSALIQFLLSCPVLKTFVMHLNCLNLPVESSFGAPVDFPGVDTLDFEFEGSDGPSVKKFIDAASFPNVSTMRLKISTSNNDAAPWIGVLNAVLPRFVTFPHLKRLGLIIFDADTEDDRDDEDEEYDYDNERQHFFHIPYSSISSVEHLEIAAMNFSMGAIPEGPCLPALQSLSFQCCKLERRWVAQLLKRFKDQGNMPQLTVMNGEWWGKVLPEDSDEDSDSEFDMSELQYHGSCITEANILSLMP